MKEFDFEKVPIVEIANEILLDGVKRGASDIHFDPFRDGLVIRMRVDGVLYDYANVPTAYKRNMISRIKMIASMNIMETRLPQDGAIKSKIGNKSLDLRVSSLPTYNGEKVVLRILDYSKSLQGLETLGFSKNSLDSILKILEIPNGIILVTGATGSGKSTTVYSILQKLNTREVNIITVEDPVEMEVEGLNQVQAQQEIGLDFATVLRSILRQDPDIIMIGEIRDDETARIAVRASITGHKVVSTIHTNNALNTIERLTDMDVERYLIGTSLNGIISQKLVRKICPHCRIAREPNDYEKNLFKKVLYRDIDKVYEPNPEGCEHCFKGYKDRTAIAEVLVINDDIRSAITNFVPKDEMRKLVYINGHTRTLLEDGLEKIAEGETSFEELYKVVDLENDLAVHESFNEEIKKDRKIVDSSDEEFHPELVNEEENTDNKIVFETKDDEEVKEELEELKEEIEEIKEEVKEQEEEAKENEELAINVPYDGLKNIEEKKPDEVIPEMKEEVVEEKKEEPIEFKPAENVIDSPIEEVKPIEEVNATLPTMDEVIPTLDFVPEEKITVEQTNNDNTNTTATEEDNIVLTNPLNDSDPSLYDTMDLSTALQFNDETKNENESINNIYDYFKPEDEQKHDDEQKPELLNLKENEADMGDVLEKYKPFTAETNTEESNNDDTEILDLNDNKDDVNFGNMLNVPFVDETVDL